MPCLRQRAASKERGDATGRPACLQSARKSLAYKGGAGTVGQGVVFGGESECAQRILKEGTMMTGALLSRPIEARGAGPSARGNKALVRACMLCCCTVARVAARRDVHAKTKGMPIWKVSELVSREQRGSCCPRLKRHN